MVDSDMSFEMDMDENQMMVSRRLQLTCFSTVS
jgi:hypothetical protein